MSAKKALPKKANIPNKRTLAAMEAARKGKVKNITLDALKRECDKIKCGK
jgi:DNA-binding Xre family transcriptional regulator